MADFRTCDIMLCSMARLINNNDKVFHGVSSHLPLIATMLAKSLHAKDAIHLNIPGGVNPNNVKLEKYTTAGSELFNNCTAYFPLSEVFDLSMRGQLDIAFLSGIQFDINGNINASVIGDYKKPKVRMPGGAGSAVLIPTVKKAIIWRTKHDKRTFVEKVDFVTTRGNIYKIITPMAIFNFENGKLKLESIHSISTVQEVKENTGFELNTQNITITQNPTKEELLMLKRIDPKDYRNIEF